MTARTILVFCITCIFFLDGCVKERNQPSYTLSGYLYQDCSMQPLANQPINLYQQIIHDPFTSKTTGGVLTSTSTDAHGYFMLRYKPQNEYPVLIETVSKSPIIGIPVDTTLTDIIAYQIPTCNIQVVLNVLNPYTEQDTLYMTDFNFINTHGVYKIAGPFTSGLAYSADSFELLGMNYSVNPFRFRYNINGGASANNWLDIDLDLQVCDSNLVVVDVF